LRYGFGVIFCLFIALLVLFPGVAAAWGPPNFVTQWGGLSDPHGTAVNASGYVYVADTGYDRVRVFDPSGAPVTQWGSAAYPADTLSIPYDVAVDANGRVYVADTGNSRVVVFTPSGGYVTQWGSYGSGIGQFTTLYGVAVGPGGNVYTVENGINRVQEFDPSGVYVRQWGGSGSGNGLFGYPYGIEVNSSGYVYVTDVTNYRVQVFDSSGMYVTQWGSHGTNNGQFTRPNGIATSADGYVYVTDFDGSFFTIQRVQVFDPSGTYVTKWGYYGTSEPGQFQYPEGVAVNGSGYAYVADTANNRVQVFTPLTTMITAVGQITGTPVVGSTLTAGVVTPAGATVSYQWVGSDAENGPYTNIAGAFGNTYVPVTGDLGRYIQVYATGTGMYSVSLNSTAAGPVTTPLTGIGPITGTPEVGSTLTAGTVTPTGATVTYQWNESASVTGPWTPVAGATGTTYVPVAGDIGRYLMVNATGTGLYTGFADSTAAGPVTAVTPTTSPTTVPTTLPTTVPTTVPTTIVTTTATSVPAYSSGQSGETLSDFPSSDLPLMTVTINIGGDSKARQAVVTGTGLRDLIVTGIMQNGPGSNVTALPGTVYQYINLVPARFSGITKAVISFTVPQAWLDENHIAPGSIVLYHQAANGWEALPTTVLSTKDGTVYFSAESASFSLFAIAGTPAPTTPATVATTQGTINNVVQPPAPSAAIVKAPVTTQTTAPPAIAPQPAAPSPLLNIVLIIAAIGVLAGGGFMVRRWWVRRQNPALFEEY
jgi:DNA-binding beta-propeller fold protein YncE